MKLDWKALTTLDWVIAGGALVAFISLFLPWYGLSVGPVTASVDGWSAGFAAWAGGLLLTAAGVLVVLRRSGVNLTGGRVGPSLLVASVAALGLLLVVIRWVSFPTYHGAGGFSYDVGARYGVYVAVIGGIAAVTGAVLALRDSGERTLWAPPEHEPAEPGPSPPDAPADPEE
jgi:hypothetical protein